jgi:predicted metalloprotease with PDZ domain
MQMFTTLALQTMLLAYPAPRDREPPDKGPGYVGVTFEAADPESVMITEIRPDGPADKAGLRVHDIIRKFDGQTVGFDTFAKKIVRIRPGTVVPVQVQRDGENLTIKLKIGLRPDDFPYALPDIEDNPLPPFDQPPPPRR